MFEVDPERLLQEGLENGNFPDLESLSLAREYAQEQASGQEFENAIIRLWHSPGGLFYEFKQFPAAFYGRLGSVQGQYLSDGEAQAEVWEALTLADKEKAKITVFYTPNLMESDQDFFMAYTLDGTRIERGEARYAMPLFLKLQTEREIMVLIRLEGEYLAFKLDKNPPILSGLRA
jgi:hypothetical protein